MITREEFEKGLWFTHKYDDEYYKLHKGFESLYIISDSGNKTFDVIKITDEYFNIGIHIFNKTTKDTIYFHNLTLRNNDNRK